MRASGARLRCLASAGNKAVNDTCSGVSSRVADRAALRTSDQSKTLFCHRGAAVRSRMAATTVPSGPSAHGAGSKKAQSEIMWSAGAGWMLPTMRRQGCAMGRVHPCSTDLHVAVPARFSVRVRVPA